MFYARDPLSQAQRVRMEQFLLPARPTPAVAAYATAGGAVRVLGYDAKGPAPAGKPLDVTVYFEGAEGTPQNLRATLEIVRHRRAAAPAAQRELPSAIPPATACSPLPSGTRATG